MTEAQERTPAPDVARNYVRDGVFAKGGLKEGFSGLRHKTLPFIAGLESSITPGWVLAILLRIFLFLAIAFYPIFIRRATGASPAQSAHFMGPPIQTSFGDSLHSLWSLISNPEPVDYVLGLIAIVLTGVPKLVELTRRQRSVKQHSPYYDLSSAILAMPSATQAPDAACDESIRLTLCALKEEMSELTGDEGKQRVTEVTLLEFCDAHGHQMQVRSRTANHEEVKRPVASGKFVAYYVAMLGRCMAEHDFFSRRNPFPKTRISVVGSPAVTYRSVLYMPIMRADRGTLPAGQHGAPMLVDGCLGVICVHSSKPYRFWRWGDHTKTTGGFADVAFERSMPYIALVKRLLEVSAPRVPVEGS